MENTVDKKTIENHANFYVLLTISFITITLFLYGIYQSSVLVSNATNVSLIDTMWRNATSISGVSHLSVGILIILIILVLNRINYYLERKNQLIGSIIRILIKIPTNLILFLIAMYIGMIAYGKISVGIEGSSLIGSSYIVDLVSVGFLLFLIIGVRKI